MFTFFPYNYISASISANSNSNKALSLLDRNKKTKWDSYSKLSTSVESIIYAPLSTTNTDISTIILKDHNFMDYKVDILASGTVLFTGRVTVPTATWSTFGSPSTTTSIIKLPATGTVDQINLTIYKVYNSNHDYRIMNGMYATSDNLVELNNPDNNNFTITKINVGTEFELYDGRSVNYRLATKNRYDISFTNISEDKMESVKSVFNSGYESIFVPFPTYSDFTSLANSSTYTSLESTGIIDTVVFIDDLNYRYSQNTVNNGYNFSIKLGQIQD